MSRRASCAVVVDDDHLDRVFGALSHRIRRALLARLGESPATIGELAEPFEVSLPAVSKHLRILEEAGLVRRDVEGRVHHCSLDTRALADAEQWLSHYRVFWDETLEALAKHMEQESD